MCGIHSHFPQFMVFYIAEDDLANRNKAMEDTDEKAENSVDDIADSFVGA